MLSHLWKLSFQLEELWSQMSNSPCSCFSIYTLLVVSNENGSTLYKVKHALYCTCRYHGIIYQVCHDSRAVRRDYCVLQLANRIMPQKFCNLWSFHWIKCGYKKKWSQHTNFNRWNMILTETIYTSRGSVCITSMCVHLYALSELVSKYDRSLGTVTLRASN